MEQLLEYNPTLETVLMVERTIIKHSGEYTLTQMWKKLPRKVMYQTYKIVIKYLKESGKIMIDKEGYLIWTWNPSLIKRIEKEKLIIR